MILYKKHQLGGIAKDPRAIKGAALGTNINNGSTFGASGGGPTTRTDLENQYVDVVKSRTEVDPNPFYVEPGRVTLQPGDFQKTTTFGPPVGPVKQPQPLGPVNNWGAKPAPPKLFNR